MVFWWTLQHCALPLVPDLKYLAFRFLAFLPGVTLLTLIYLRIRRLPLDDRGALADGSGRGHHDVDAPLIRFARRTWYSGSRK